MTGCRLSALQVWLVRNGFAKEVVDVYMIKTAISLEAAGALSL